MSTDCAPLSAHTYVHNTFIEVKFTDQCDDVNAGLRRSASAPALLTPIEVEEVEHSSEPAVTAAVTAPVHLPLQAPRPDQEEAACPRTRLTSAARPFVPLTSAARPFVPAKTAKAGALTLDLPMATFVAPATQQAAPCWGLDLVPVMALGSSKDKNHQQQHQQPMAPHPGGKQDDAITTVIMHNVPYSMNRDRLVELLEWGGFGGQYDFLYLPIDFNSKNTKGYCFVNLTDPDYMKRFFDVFEGFGDWGCQFCQKKCRLQINRTQGWHANVRRYRNSALMDPSVPDEYKPAIFKDGVRIPFLEPRATH